MPSMLDLLRLSPRRLFPPGGRELYRQIARLTGMEAGSEVLVVGCGRGITLEYFVQEYGVHGSGIDPAEKDVLLGQDRVRELSLGDQLQIQPGSPANLPYRDAIFDIVVGELGITASAAPAQAIEELARVTRPGGAVALVQLVWKAPVDEHRREVLEDHLGIRPLMLVEWKRLLREAGVTGVRTEDWTDTETAFRPRVAKPFPDFAELFTLPEKVGILGRAWSRWGLGGVRDVLARERAVHSLLTRERILGLDLLTGVKAAAAPVDASGGVEEKDEGNEGVDGLPLFAAEADVAAGDS